MASQITTQRSLLLSFTKLLAAHVNQGRHHKALRLFYRMHASSDISLDSFVLPLALKSCAALNLPSAGYAIHTYSIKSAFIFSPFVACALLSFYGKCVNACSARFLFDEIPQRNVVVWNAMMSVCCFSNDIQSAIELYKGMDVAPTASTFNAIISSLSERSKQGPLAAVDFFRQMCLHKVLPNLITLMALLRSCMDLCSLNLIKEIHGFSIRNYIYPHSHLSSSLIESYGRCGCLINARILFVAMPDRDMVSWSTMVSAYAFHGHAEEALSTFRQMLSAQIQPDGIAFLGVLKACSHAGLPDRAMDYFGMMSRKYSIEPGQDHYGCLVDVLSRSGRLQKAYEVIQGMPMKASPKAWGALLCGCRTYGNVELAEIAAQVLFEIEPENAGNFVLLSSIYASVGKFKESDRVRTMMKERRVRSLPGSSWTHKIQKYSSDSYD